MNLPAVSCYCNTFGRVHTLQEVLQSFLNQDYNGVKELVIFNDLAEQELIYDHPEVRIINLKERITPLGRKFNQSIEHCRYNILACWEDDDIYLPNHISTAISRMKNGIFHTHFAWHEEEIGKLIYSYNYFHATHVFSRDLFDQVGGYPEIDESRLDVDIMAKFQNAVGNYSTELSAENLTYIYRWGTAQCYHGSGWLVNLTENSANFIKNHLDNNTIPVGKIHLQPNWRYNYTQTASTQASTQCQTI